MVMKKSRLLGAVYAFTLLALVQPAHAALITSISSLDIGGKLYNVTFHSDTSFNALWDADDNGVFGGGGSVFSSAPTFWGDSTLAHQAALAIANYLGPNDETASRSDSFLVPYRTAYGTPIGPGYDTISTYSDVYFNTYSDTVMTTSRLDSSSYAMNPYASFSAVVTVPPAVWLFGSGLIGLIGIARRKKA